MKHLKRFNEELEPRTYRSAAWKLRDYNKDKKSKNLLDWADKQEFGYYNMCLVNSSSVIAKNDTFTRFLNTVEVLYCDKIVILVRRVYIFLKFIVSLVKPIPS